MWGRAFAIASCLVLAPRGLAAGDQVLKPVKFKVIDVVTKEPVTDFSYSLSVIVPGEVDDRRVLAAPAHVHVKSPTGEFVVQAPASCMIELDVDSPDVVAGYRHNETPVFQVLSTDTKRQYVVQVELGMTVRGVVRDAATERPIAGATVAPIIDMHQARGPFMKRAVTTDADGRFRIRGVNPEWGALVLHPEHKTHYIPCKDPEAIRRGEHLIELRAGQKETIRGIIRDDESRPVAGASISGWNQTTSSAQDGRFTLIIPPPDYTDGRIEVKKPGYGDHEMRIQLPVADDVSVVLVPRFVVEGTVQSSQGQPLPSFTIAVGPKLEPNHWDCVSQDVRDPTGHFSVAVKDSGSNRVVVKAAGLAVWEGAVAVARKSAPVAIQLQPGVKLSGLVARPTESRSHLEATLIPNPKEGFENLTGETGRDLSTLKARVEDDGSFHFDHVRPDGYQLRIDGKDITPVQMLIEVEARDVDVGTLQVIGTGRIVGTLHRAGGLEESPWPFADIHVASEPARQFESHLVTGEDGRFVFENVSAGINYVVVHYSSLTGDQGQYGWGVQVLAGRTTEVRTFDRSKDSRLELLIAVGDGSQRHFEIGRADPAPDHQLLSFLQQKPSFELEVIPRSNQVSSFSAGTNPGNRSNRDRILLKDVSPGAYHVRLLEAPEYVGAVGSLLQESNILMKPGAQPIQVTLGAASIQGKVEGGEYGSIIAIDQASKLPPRRVHYSGDGAFAIRFVRKGTYSLIAHDDSHGWGRGPLFQVGNEIAKAPPLKLVPGGEIRGRIVARTPCAIPDSVVAVDAEGIEIPDGRFARSGLMQFRIPHLWPGDWTVRMLKKETVIASTRVRISGKETVTSDLVVDSARTR